jgi:hypothetical protein
MRRRDEEYDAADRLDMQEAIERIENARGNGGRTS